MDGADSGEIWNARSFDKPLHFDTLTRAIVAEI